MTRRVVQRDRAARPHGEVRVDDERVVFEPAALPDPPASSWLRGDIWPVVGALLLIGLAAVVGRTLQARGVTILLPRPPLLAFWHPHVGWGSPLALLCVLAGLRLQRRAAQLRWTRLLVLGWLLMLAWMCSLALVDGFGRGWTQVLLNPNEYLHDLPRIRSPFTFMATFTRFIAFGRGVTGNTVWTTHVAAHPPLATLVFWLLDRVGLGGGLWAGTLCILVSSVTAIAMPATLRELGAPMAARRLVPFAALLPGAVWMAVSADGLFAGVASGGLALVCRGASRRRLVPALVGGLLLGVAVFLSYGLVVFGIVVMVAAGLTCRAHGLRPVVTPWLVAAAAAGAVAAVHAGLGFNWFVGLAALRVRYYQGVASQRPFSYFIYADLAAWLVSCSPVLAVGVARGFAVIVSWRRSAWTQDRIVALVALAGVAAALTADLSAMSKAETERIWLAFGVVANTSLALLRGRRAAWGLVGCAGWAIAVNHLLNTGW